MQSIVEDLAVLAQLVGSGIDKGLVLEVLVEIALHGIDGQEWAVQVQAAATRHAGARQVFAHQLRVLVVQGVGPEGGIVGETIREKLQGLLEEGLSSATLAVVAHAVGNLVEVDSVHVVVAKVLQNLLLGPVLGDPCPGGHVPLAQLVDHLEDERGGSRHSTLVVRHLDGVDRVFAGLGKVEVEVVSLGGVGLEPEGSSVGVVPALQGNGPRGNLGQVTELADRGGRVGDNHLTTVGDPLEELVLDEVVQPFPRSWRKRESAR